MLLLQTLLIAQAETGGAAPCQPAYVEGSQPIHTLEGVPIDVVPALLFSDPDCGGDEWQLTMSQADGPEVVSIPHSIADRGLIAELDAGGELLPETRYEIVAEPAEGASQLAEIGFVTGTSTVRGLEGVPRISSIASGTVEIGEETTFMVRVEPASDPDGLSVVAVAFADREDELLNPRRGSDDNMTLTARRAVEPDSTVCFIAFQRDGRGDWARSEEVCETARGSEDPATGAPCGCAATSTSGGTPGSPGPGIAAALALLVAARRRA